MNYKLTSELGDALSMLTPATTSVMTIDSVGSDGSYIVGVNDVRGFICRPGFVAEFTGDMQQDVEVVKLVIDTHYQHAPAATAGAAAPEPVQEAPIAETPVTTPGVPSVANRLKDLIPDGITIPLRAAINNFLYFGITYNFFKFVIFFKN